MNQHVFLPGVADLQVAFFMKEVGNWGGVCKMDSFLLLGSVTTVANELISRLINVFNGGGSFIRISIMVLILQITEFWKISVQGLQKMANGVAVRGGRKNCCIPHKKKVSKLE